MIDYAYRGFRSMSLEGSRTPSERARAHETYAMETTVRTIYHVLYTILQSF
jgi:hypothetical protein